MEWENCGRELRESAYFDFGLLGCGFTPSLAIFLAVCCGIPTFLAIFGLCAAAWKSFSCFGVQGIAFSM